ncbi:hypothetical protein M0638_07100 [Roseomonas sp. NAR14]|uniref:Uncharacterized protein n=1 Tax=Roseomonas acroporae TaxID=2937791 RepID=A0A9X1Y8N2_9PROT|nr:hypothetical protein [Roseomonas acroporae]MCK8784142.1 hypothetical protein [Roseomonas acroporae]
MSPAPIGEAARRSVVRLAYRVPALPGGTGAAGERAAAAIQERALALAVLQLAIADLTAPARRDSSSNARAVCAEERRQARLFLFSPDGAWAAARHAWCDAAGVAPAWLERRVAALLPRGAA